MEGIMSKHLFVVTQIEERDHVSVIAFATEAEANVAKEQLVEANGKHGCYYVVTKLYESTYL